MARKKTITREHILSAVFEVISTEGFSGFTARNIANKMKTSTQPIYLEFKNMDELRNVFIDQVTAGLRNEVYNQSYTDDCIVDLIVNYVKFASENSVFYKALFVDNHDSGTKLNKFTRNLFYDKINQDDVYAKLSDEVKEAIFTNCWVMSVGLSSLAASNRAKPTVEEIEVIIKNVIEMSKKHPKVSLTKLKWVKWVNK